MRKKLSAFLIATTAVGSILFLGLANSYSSGSSPAGYDQADLKRGAQLYDNWAKVTGQKYPEGNHPAYPVTSKKSGSTTWRCKECHGWDYVGKNGRYKSGSHYTGIEGVRMVQNKSAEDISNTLQNDATKHNFSKYLSKQDLMSLTKFVKEGTLDISKAIDAEGNVLGDAAKGKEMFAMLCAGCHGDDGNKYDFEGDEEGVQGIGFLANDNPQETLHKILWGNPKTEMPSLIVDSEEDFSVGVDILKYAQTLGK